jgi:hypothetical protein
MLSLVIAMILGAATPPTPPPPPTPPAGMHSFNSQTDTLVDVKPGTSLELSNFGGQIDVKAWRKNVVKVAARHSRRVHIEIEEVPEALNIRAVGYRMVPSAVDYQIVVPEWMPLNLSGMHTDISIDGIKAAVKAGTVSGGIRLRGGRGELDLSSVEGVVEVEDADGALQLSSVNEAVRVARCLGEISAQSVNGPIVLDALSSRSVEAETVNGEVFFDGAILADGEYRFTSHNGDIVVGIAPGTNADVSVSTFNGGFESSFPVQLSETRRGRCFNFMLGSGGAKLDLESFGGSIQLRRRGAAHPKE